MRHGRYSSHPESPDVKGSVNHNLWSSLGAWHAKRPQNCGVLS